MTSLLEQITISEDFCNWAIDWIRKQHKTESEKQLQILKNLYVCKKTPNTILKTAHTKTKL